MGWIVALLLGTSAVAVVASEGWDDDVSEPVVSVVGGASEELWYAGPCTDAVVPVDQVDSFVVRLDRTTTTDLTVAYRVGEVRPDAANGVVTGTAQSGVHYVPLPGSAVVPAGSDRVEVALAVLSGGAPSVVGFSVLPDVGDGYRIDEASGADLVFISDAPPDAAPQDCNPSFQFTDAPSNHYQAIAVGQGLRALELTEDAADAHVVEGALPPGIALNGDGSFSGTATAAGAYTAVLELAPYGMVWTPRRTALTVDVAPAGEPVTDPDATEPTPTEPTPTEPDPTELPIDIVDLGTLIGHGDIAQTICGTPTADATATETGPTATPTQPAGAEGGPINAGGDPRVRLTADDSVLNVGESVTIAAAFEDPPPADAIINWSLDDRRGGLLAPDGCGATYHAPANLGTAFETHIQVLAWTTSGTPSHWFGVESKGRGVWRILIRDAGNAPNTSCATATLNVRVDERHGPIVAIRLQGVGAWAGWWPAGSAVAIPNVPRGLYTLIVTATQVLEQTVDVGCVYNLAWFK